MTTTKADARAAMEAQGRTLYCDEEVLASMPEGADAIVEFFTLGKYVSDDELAKEYADRGLTPASPYDVALILRKNLTKFVATHWKNAAGQWCYATFCGWTDGPNVGVYRSRDDWDGGWAFAGVRTGSGAALRPLGSLPSSADAALEEAIATVKAAGYKIFKEV